MTQYAQRGFSWRNVVAVAALTLGLTATTLVAQDQASAAPTNFYVSTTGNDTTGSGTSGSPWKTIQKAQQYIRTNNLNDAMTDDIIVNVAAGYYYQTSTIQFTQEDSGSNGHQVIYKNWNGIGSARIVGGQVITGWTSYSGNIYRANVGVGADFFTLYENGKRVRMARTPNYVPDLEYPMAKAPYLTAEGEISNMVLRYASGDLSPSGWDIDDAEVVIWSGGHFSWFTDTVPITSINTGSRQITLDNPTRYQIHNGAWGSRYFVQGALPLLDQPGEFFLDSSAGYLYYWAMDGAIGSQTIVAPTVKRLVSLTGSSTSNVAHDIVFDGLAFEYSDFTGWYRQAHLNDGDSGEGHTYPEYDRQINLPAHRTGMIYLENTEDITITNSHIKNSGYSAIYMLFHNQGNTVSNNWIEHVGIAGVLLEGPYPGEGNSLRDNVITNNHITKVGELTGAGSGVYLMNAYNNTVSYSEISESPRYAVAIDAYPDINPKSAIYAYNNTVDHIRVHHTSQDSGDTGALYSFGISDDAPYLTNTYSQITVDHVYSHPSMPDAKPDGIFMDNDSFGQTFSNVEVTNVEWNLFRNNDSGSHSLTNVNWSGSFNPASMDYANIGVKSTFPWPVTPNKLAGTFSSGVVNLSWQGSLNATSYTVKRSSTSGGPYSTTVCSGSSSTTCTDSSPIANGYYVVTATISGGAESPVSREVRVLASSSDGFEAGLSAWTTRDGSPTVSTTQKHSGAQSALIDGDREVISRSVTPGTDKVATIWFRDDASDTTVETVARVDNSTWDGSAFRAMGVDTTISTTHYIYRVDGSYTTTPVARSTGWHELRWDYSSGTDVKLYIDGVLVGSPTGVTTFSQIAMGDWWAGSSTATIYFDDTSVPANRAGFESGMTGWTTRDGSPAASTTQKHSGAQSFVQNEDREVISRSVTPGADKVVTVWFRDDASDATVESVARVDNAAWDGAAWRAIGADTTISSNFYVYRVDGTYTTTSVARSTGWHEFRWDYSSGTDVKLYIDGVLVGSPTGVTTFSQIAMGDWWSDGNVSTVYYDDAAY